MNTTKSVFFLFLGYKTDNGSEVIEIQSIDTTNNIVFIKSQKNNAQLVYKMQIYNKKGVSQLTGHTTWRCAERRKYKCLATIISGNNELVRANLQHTHNFNHYERIKSRPVYEFEEDLDEYIEINSTDPNICDKINIVDTGKEFKLIVSDNMSCYVKSA
jgi:lipopolysaccharide export LptBFGC system permease protein LptF